MDRKSSDTIAVSDMKKVKPFLSIVIKALNEEQKIGKAICSALAVEGELGKPIEVVLADSISTDSTVEIAKQFPIRIVQFENLADRGCGAGVQLGYQYALGDFVYFLDGDMEIVPGFVPKAVELLQQDSRLAGVSGALLDTQITNDIDRIRINNRAATQAGMANWLVGGGIYRKSAIDASGGYAADRNLKGYEEAELGLRLTSNGWKLTRLSDVSVRHTGHSLDTWALLARHWRSRRAMSAGVLLRSAIGQPWLTQVVKMLIHPLATGIWLFGFVFWAMVAVFVPAWSILILLWSVAPLVIYSALLMKKRDIRHASISLVSWLYGAFAIFLGCFEPVVCPSKKIEAQLLHDAGRCKFVDTN